MSQRFAYSLEITKNSLLYLIYFYVFLYSSEPVVKHSSDNTDIEFENMDFLELTSSQEHLLFEAVCNVS